MASSIKQIVCAPGVVPVQRTRTVGLRAPAGGGNQRVSARTSAARPGRHARIPCTSLAAFKHRVFSAETSESTAIGSPAWVDFAKAVSGEWEGATSSFGADGTVRELPSYYVPDAYREWEVKVVDWTHMTSSLAEDDGLLTAVKRFMPTVGCEADAVAYVDESLKSLQCGDGHGGEAKTISRDGSYSIGTRILASDGDGFMKHRIEACVTRDEKNRVRLVYTLQRNNADTPWKIMNLDVFNEGYVGEYEGGTDLRSCGGASGYGDTPRTDIEDICGTWNATSTAAYECFGDDLKLRAVESPDNSIDLKETEGIICLPQGVWSRFRTSGSDVSLESGCFISPGKQHMVSRNYEDGKLCHVVFQDLARADS